MSDTTKPAETDDRDTVKDLLTADDTEDESDELFSDDDQKKESKFSSDAFQDVSVSTRSETPLLSFGYSSSNTINPRDAVVPSTPLSLLPFLSKVNEQWTSDLETPQAQLCNAKAATSTAEKTEETPKCKQSTPDVRHVDNNVSDSPVIASRAVRKRPKRRIFRSFISIDPLAVTNDNDILTEVETLLASEHVDTVTRDDVPSGASVSSTTDDVPKDHKSKVCNPIKKICNGEESDKLRNTDNLNTSTQDFFNNASFSNVDKLCSNNFDKRTTNESIESVENERNVEVNENVGFFTARGASINVSKKALFKAKRLFADAFDADETQAENYEPPVKRNSIERKDKHLPSSSFVDGASISIAKEALSKPKLQFTEQLNNYDIIDNYEKQLTNKSPAEDVIPILFSTASGAPIKISKEALSKANMLLADGLNKDNDDDSVLIKHYEKRSEDRNSTKQSSIIVSSFSTANNIKSVAVSKTSLAKTRIIFAEHLDTAVESIKSNKADNSDNKYDVRPSNMGFQTASGKAVNISEQALSKAKALLAEHLNNSSVHNPLESDATNEIRNDDDKVQRQETILEVGFQTARGTSISISKEALSRAKALFADQLENSSETDISKNINHDDEKLEKYDGKIPSIGFHTARGTSIGISKEALSRAKALFADQFDHPSKIDISENVNRDDKEIKEHVKNLDGYQSTNNQQVTISNKAPLKRELFSNDCKDESTPDNMLTSLQKDKLSSDENTPLGRNSVPESKKARLSNEFLARRLSFDNLNAVANKEEEPKSKDTYVTSKLSTNDTDDESRKLQSTCVADLSNEIVASTVKLCLDEKKQVDSVTEFGLGSPERDTERSDLDAASPVIGRQPVSKKRKSLGYRKDRIQNVPIDEMTPNNENNPRNLAARADKTEKNESSAETQPERQSGNAESNEYGDTQMMMDFIDESAKILRDRLAAALQQEQVITAKRRSGSSEQLTGHLYRHKQATSKARLSLRQIANGVPPTPRSHQELIDRRIPPNILAITATTAASYKFRCSDFYGSNVARDNVRGIQMGDGVCLILDENGYVGVWEFLRAFLASPGVDPNLVPARWLENHYRWIVWKLASMDRMKFGTVELPRALTPSRVMAQLKYRYDREIDRSQRSAVRRILEKDDVASKRMILCVSSIVENNNTSTETGKSPRIGVSKWKVELTDGWYGIPACIDVDFARGVSVGKIKEGTKLVVSGAELLNCDQGCYPLEAPADVCLKLHANSTRRARWDTKLGYASRSGPIPIRLRNVCASGGLIGRMTITVARVYPMLYHERTASGDSIVRNAKCEEKAQSKHEQQCWSNIEAFYAKAEDFQGDGLSCETAGMTIQLSEDYERLSTEEFVSKKQRDELMQELRLKEEIFKRELQSKLRASLPAPRQVSTLLKVRVCDEDANAILAIWSPSEEVVDALKEGGRVSLSNVVAAGKRGCELQLTARRSAIFKPAKTRDARSYPARVCTPFCEIANSNFAPPYGEFDTVGFVCCVGPAPYGMKDFEAVHLAYLETDSGDPLYLSILFWQGIARFGYTEILTVGSIVACSNLEWRRATSWNVPAAYCTDRSTFTCNPRRNHLYESFENLRNLITEPVKYVERCTSKLNAELQKKPTPTRYTPGKITPNKICNSGSNVDKALIDYTSPLSRPEGSSNTNFTATNPSIQRRLEKLQFYGDAPELSPIVLRRSKKLSLDFKSPISDVISTREDTSSIDNQSNNKDPPDAL